MHKHKRFMIIFKENSINLSLLRHDNNYQFLSAKILKWESYTKTIKTNSIIKFLS